MKRNWHPSPNAQRASDTHYICGHPRDEANSTREAHPRCLECHRRRQVKGYTRFKCGHDITPDNTVLSTQLFDLEFTKTNKGQVRNTTKTGLIHKLLDFVNPF